MNPVTVFYFIWIYGIKLIPYLLLICGIVIVGVLLFYPPVKPQVIAISSVGSIDTPEPPDGSAEWFLIYGGRDFHVVPNLTKENCIKIRMQLNILNQNSSPGVCYH